MATSVAFEAAVVRANEAEPELGEDGGMAQRRQRDRDDSSPGGIVVVDAATSGRLGDAAQLVFEYLVLTEKEVGGPLVCTPHDLPTPLRRERANLPASFPEPGGVLVAPRKGAPIGVVALRALDARRGEVRRLYVRDGARGGVGRRLMSTVEHRAQRAGIEELVLGVLPGRSAALHLYHELGYRQVPRPPGDPYGLVHLHKVLTA